MSGHRSLSHMHQRQMLHLQVNEKLSETSDFLSWPQIPRKCHSLWCGRERMHALLSHSDVSISPSEMTPTKCIMNIEWGLSKALCKFPSQGYSSGKHWPCIMDKVSWTSLITQRMKSGNEELSASSHVKAQQ